MELVIKNLSKTYANGVRALSDVTMTVYWDPMVPANRH